MNIQVNGKTIELAEEGYLEQSSDWDEDVAQALATIDSLELNEEHMQVIHYLREEHINNAGSEPNDRTIMKTMGKLWGNKPTSKYMYELFPGTPSKQGRKVAGLPKSTRKGGY